MGHLDRHGDGTTELQSATDGERDEQRPRRTAHGRRRELVQTQDARAEERQGRSQLLFFASPDCPMCKSLLPIVRSAARAEAGWLDIVVAGDGGKPGYLGMVRDHGLESLPVVLSEALGRAFGVPKLPYAVLLDEEGRVASLGLVNSREHLESLFEAKERGVASIQDYLARRQHNHQEA